MLLGNNAGKKKKKNERKRQLFPYHNAEEPLAGLVAPNPTPAPLCPKCCWIPLLSAPGDVTGLSLGGRGGGFIVCFSKTGDALEPGEGGAWTGVFAAPLQPAQPPCWGGLLGSQRPWHLLGYPVAEALWWRWGDGGTVRASWVLSPGRTEATQPERRWGPCRAVESKAVTGSAHLSH